MARSVEIKRIQQNLLTEIETGKLTEDEVIVVLFAFKALADKATEKFGVDYDGD